MDMSNQIQAVHLKIRYQCDQCDHQSLKPYFLHRHIEHVHLNSGDQTTNARTTSLFVKVSNAYHMYNKNTEGFINTIIKI